MQARHTTTAVLAGLMLVLASACAVPAGDTASPEATPQARFVLGPAAPYPARPLDEAALEEARTSVRARRRLAWEIVARVVEPVAIPGGGEPLPRWVTWYAREDLDRMFRRLYTETLSPELRRSRAPFGKDLLDAAEVWNAGHVVGLPSWPETRLRDWIATLDDAAAWQGLVGASRTLYSPDAARHALASYRSAADCPAIAAATPPEAPGEPRAPCLSGEFPAGAVVLKTSWSRRDFGLKAPAYDTSAATLAGRLGDPTASWGAGERHLQPDAADIFAVRAESGANFGLMGLHIASKEAPDWLWITLWWSDEPDTDFGEDRPDDLPALQGPWGHYKMCVATAFDEGATVDAAYAAEFPSLAAALAATARHTAPHSWCSNPYFEQGAGNHRTNCIGCHQHAGGLEAPLDVARQRQTVPADYLWSLVRAPENLAALFRKRIEHHDLHD